MLLYLIATRRLKEEPVIDDCKAYTSVGDLNDNEKLSSAKPLCVKTDDGFLVLGTDITIKGVDAEGKDIGTVKNAFGASATLNEKKKGTDTFFRISTTKDEEQDVAFARLPVPSTIIAGKENAKTVTDQVETYVVLKNSFLAKITYLYRNTTKESVKKQMEISFYHPNKMSVTATGKVDAYIESNNGELDKDPYVDTNGIFFISSKTHYQLLQNEDWKLGEWKASAMLTFTSSKAANLPDKVIRLVPGGIYSESTKNTEITDFLDESSASSATEEENNKGEDEKEKLSGGAIAGIVVGSVAAVGIAGVCIWYFLFHLKSAAAAVNP